MRIKLKVQLYQILTFNAVADSLGNYRLSLTDPPPAVTLSQELSIHDHCQDNSKNIQTQNFGWSPAIAFPKSPDRLSINLTGLNLGVKLQKKTKSSMAVTVILVDEFFLPQSFPWIAIVIVYGSLTTRS